eukprot:TRINITY_DN7579_c0_g1_i1.p2 TRINITY_DN7579_c0_g1~~TRINITY_DN7579_c0_g1_i1.p2  ORF type:complete len:92 (-),score=18.33 TRINITY_DN7579_c0_g1_i1:108-383(-)
MMDLDDQDHPQSPIQQEEKIENWIRAEVEERTGQKVPTRTPNKATRFPPTTDGDVFSARPACSDRSQTESEMLAMQEVVREVDDAIPDPVT